MFNVFRGRVVSRGAIGDENDVVNDKGECLTDLLDSYMGKKVTVVIEEDMDKE